ncbi:MAG TPA: tetratricopeptide repeat protein [Candidatus Angelobacter sp.]|nr:tetratricopeptide repeat protein [Candidatus Angelobacter sp.]
MPLVSLLGTTLIMLAASLAVESQSAVNHICPAGEAHMKVDPGKLAQDYPAQSFDSTLHGLRELENRISLAPDALEQAGEATQQWKAILKGISDGYASCTISQKQYDDLFLQVYPLLRDNALELEKMRQAAAKGENVDSTRLSRIFVSYLDNLHRFTASSSNQLVDATALNALATELLNQGDYARAEPLYRNALTIREKILGQEDLHVAVSINNLAVLLKRKGDYAGARDLYRQALAIREKLLGPDHPDVALELNNLGELLRQTGDVAGAQPLLQRALTIWEKSLHHDRELALTLNNLALVLRQKGDLDGAESLHRRALSVRRFSARTILMSPRV